MNYLQAQRDLETKVKEADLPGVVSIVLDEGRIVFSSMIKSSAMLIMAHELEEFAKQLREDCATDEDKFNLALHLLGEYLESREPMVKQ